MPTYRRLRIVAEELNISAFILPVRANDIEEDMDCLKCLPRKPKQKQLVGVVQYGKTSDKFYTVYECTRCHRQWAVPYFTAEVTPE